MQEKCPRCGEPVSHYREKSVGDRIYIYAVHYRGKRGGKSVLKECYLGPKGGYEYVSRLHEREGLVLKGLLDPGRILEYLDTIVEYVTSTEVEPGLRNEILKRVKRISKALK